MTLITLLAPFLIGVGSASQALAQTVRQAPQAPSAGTVLGLVWLAAFGIMVISTWASGFTAKRINNISGATYSKAFLATFLKGLMSLTGFFVFGLYLDAPPIVALARHSVPASLETTRIRFRPSNRMAEIFIFREWLFARSGTRPASDL